MGREDRRKTGETLVKRGVLSETAWVVRPVCVFVVAIAVTACAMAIKGWVFASLLLAAVLAMIGVLLVYEVHRAVSRMTQGSTSLAQAAAEAERHYVHVLREIVDCVEARDSYMCKHSERVAWVSEAIARRMGLSNDRAAMVKLAGQLHDIGMLAISEAVLKDRSRMSVDGFRSVRKHPTIAYHLLKPLESVAEILPAILHHHERLNGTGYPDGLRGDRIPLEARILAVADSFDAMTHDRPYRHAMTKMNAIAELRRCAPAGYDAACVDALADVINLPALQDALGQAEGVEAPAGRDAGCAAVGMA